MATTTLKVPTELRDRIQGASRGEKKTMVAFLTNLVDEYDRAHREESLRAAIAASPPDDEYWAEFAAFAGMDAELPVE